jgi:hypothetical protein
VEKTKVKEDLNTQLVEELQAENTTLREKSAAYQLEVQKKEELVRQLQRDRKPLTTPPTLLLTFVIQ